MESSRWDRCRFLAGCAVAAVLVWGMRPAAGQDRPATGQGPTIDAGFPGGNIVLERIEGDDVYLHQDPRDTAGFWFYWNFRVGGAAGRTLAFHFTQGNVLGVRGPAVSADGGRTWQWLGAEAVRGASFAFHFPDRAQEVRFCLAVPYQEADLDAFLQRHADSPDLRVEPHATTPGGRQNRRLRLGRLDGPPDRRVVLTCRHHCCEMMASWALEGLMDAVLAEDDVGRWLRGHVEFLVVPLMDLDGVEDGDQGKNRRPHDHNRDYLGESLYPSVAAIREFVPGWSDGKLRIALDMHCPYIRGGGDGPSSNERIFFVGGPSQQQWQNVQEFSGILQKTQTGPLVYHPRNNLPHGQKWNNMAEPRSFGRWAATLPGVSIATTVEIPYANVAGKPVTPDTARAFGRDLARAMRRYLAANP